MAFEDDPLFGYEPGIPEPLHEPGEMPLPADPSDDAGDLSNDITDLQETDVLTDAGLILPIPAAAPTTAAAPEDQGWYPPPEDPQGMDDRDYSGDRFFPVEEHGSYADHYPEDAERMDRRRASNDRDQRDLADQDVNGVAARVLDTLRNCLAGMHGRTGTEMIDMVTYAMASEHALAYLGKSQIKVYQRLSEIFIGEYAEDHGRVVDLTDIAGIEAASSKVQAELAMIVVRLANEDLPRTPTATWRALVNFVQRMTSRARAQELITEIDSDGTDEDCMDVFRNMQPPSASRALVNASFARTAQEWEEADLAAAAEAPGFRISSGYPTLDFAFTQKDGHGEDTEPRGSWGPGEMHIVAAPTGSGKSAAGRRLITAAAEDLVVGWGREHDKVLIAITEESPKIVYQVAGLAKGQQFHHLAKNIVIASIGASRRRLIHAVWDCVVAAYHRSKETGMPVINCGLPSFVVVDYVGGIVEDGELADTTAIEKTANLMMRGIAAWDVQMMEVFSGESFAAYAGMSWPTGMDSFQPAVLGFAQFKKLADPQWYDPSIRNISVEDFYIPNADGEPGWEVQTGDFRIPTQGEVRGSGVLINHATSLIILHRSRPQKNPKVIDKETGRVHLADDRARWLLVKTRNGSDCPFVEMRFDSIPSGLRGQFFDYRAEIAMERGYLSPTECYQEVGDPILPFRPVRTPFDGVAY